MVWRTIAALLLTPSLALAQTSSSGGFISTAGVTCSQTCSSESFSTNPFDNSFGSPRWTRHPESSTCPIHWDDLGNSLRRSAASDLVCDHNTGLVRFNGDIARDGCAMFRVVETDDGAGAGATGGFEVGLVMRHQKPIPPTPGRVDGLFGSTPEENGALVVRCESDLTCASLRLAHVASFQDVNLTCDTFADASDGDGALVEGSYFGACIHGTDSDGQGTVNVFNLGTTYPGAPETTEGGAGVGGDPGWGDPECTFTVPCQGGAGVCDDSGNFFGIWMRTNDVSEGAVYSVDDFRAFSCQGI